MSQQRIINDRYEVGELIGRGGMADVYMGKDIRLGRRVAIKMMRPDLARDPQFQSRFQREAQSSAALNHPNIVAVFDTGEDSIEAGPEFHGVSCPFMVMEYVDGKTLRSLLRESEVPVSQAVEWTLGVLDAVSYSHEREIVHRDLKPANVMVTNDGEVKVMDFGIARALSDSSATMTQTQAVVGTAQYLSPEQARGETVDYRSDLYSVGCLLFELLTGRPPFVGDSPVSVAYQHVREDPPAASAINPKISPALDSVLNKALAKDVEDRFQTGREFAKALSDAYEHGVSVGEHDPDATQVNPVVAPVPGPDDTQAMAATTAIPTAAAASSEADPFTPSDGYTIEDDEEPEEAHHKEKKSNKKAWITILILLLLAGAAAGGWYLYQQNEQRKIEESQVEIPDVAGMEITDAQNELTRAGLRPIVENQHDDDVEVDHAIGTDPKAGETAQRDDEITLYISMGPDQVEIPEDLQGASEATVRATLEDLGLQVSQEITYVNSATIDRDRLVDTNPSLGSTVAYGSTVSLSMSSGQVEIPDVTGMTVDEAEKALGADDVGLRLNNVQEQESDQRPGTILSQSPQAGTSIDAGSGVNVVVAVEPVQEEESESPSPSPSDEESEEESDSPSPSESESSSSSEDEE